ncbi:amino acid adenylation domain-containing protein [Actinomadura harenae]|uniref:D-alanine--poly(Phosphoribitol) ligase n=1 Tax=Actinomadura harenae TaxID=2483351 RepID=A0A3M2M7L0_9ACTN|nr:amino acid adenylation domain-containing protein [Actinomadura harenae]RMI45512.1 D-alanine--poly(phosphoribitol) ligase [Actinomadura harenae]
MSGLDDHLRHWARTRPDAPAVEYQGRTLTYGELDARSSALAATLIGNGVAPGDRVGLWARKSIESVIAIHGVLKTGAAYVPIDPSAPFKRAGHIIEHCDVACVIAQDDRVGWLREHFSCPIVSVGPQPLDESVIGWDQALAATGDPGLPDVDLQSPAYILHTSGSKGTPKGVVLSHGNAVAFVEWAVGEFGLGPSDRVSSHAPFHFDLSVLDLFATCAAGGCVVLVPESQVGLGGALNKFVTDQRITVWYSVPGALTRMLAAKNGDLLAGSSLRVVLFAGEPFPLTHLRRLHALVPGAAFYNLYGPTETNVCLFHRVRASDVEPHLTRPVPIGRPCPYARAFVVDRDGRPLDPEPGRTGELCVAGDSVMLGYWQDDALTASKTLLIPRDGAEPLEAYRTGDLVRIDDDLNHVFLGREDDMVKIRGHRVEIGEVEAVLSAAENVREVACVVVGDGPDDRVIEAYLVPEEDPLDVPRVRRHCLAELPRYMVPERFHVVAGLPTTGTGKIDRRGLAGA